MSVNVKDVIPLKWDISKLIPHDSPNSRYNRNNVLKNYEVFDGIFEIIIEFNDGQFNTELETNIGITNNFITAIECLGASLYSASILFASATVECILNHDMRLDSYRKGLSNNTDYQWIMLNPTNLQKAEDEKIPVKMLCDLNDDFPTDVKFVKWRNKIAHGDTEGYRKSQLGSHTSKSHTSSAHTVVFLQPEKGHALEQIVKVQKFIEAWGKTTPKLRLH